MVTSSYKHYIKFLSKKHDEFEEKFYRIVDDFEQKAGDLKIKAPRVFSPTFQFLQSWIDGDLSAKEVYEILVRMDPAEVAKKQITRTLTAFMFQNEPMREYTKYSLSKLNSDVVPLYSDYLKYLTTYFKILTSIESNQIPVTWIEKSLHSNGTIHVTTYNMFTDQLIKKFRIYDMGNSKKKLKIGINLLRFTEEYNNIIYENIVIGPRSYIDRIASVFNIKMTIYGNEIHQTMNQALKDLK